MKTIILLSTQTSATGSINRILNILKKPDTKIVFFDKNKKELLGERLNSIPSSGHIVLHNRPDLLKYLSNKSDYRYIINFRDPRDRLCNKYHWMQQHPLNEKETREQLILRAEKIKEVGIDKWVESEVNTSYESQLISFIDSLPEKSYCVATYAGLCLDFDEFIKKLASFIGVDLTNKHWEALECERIESLDTNKAYIGNQWSGSDVMPGRFKGELRQSTIKILNTAYFSILRSMAKYDKDFSHLYLEGLPNNIPFFDLPKKLTLNFDSADILREVALQFEESGDISTALTIMSKALALRPTGPLIQRKVAQYQAILSKNQH